MVTSGCCVGLPARRISCLRGSVGIGGERCVVHETDRQSEHEHDSAKVTISKCNDTANTGGKGTTQSSEGAPSSKITWAGGKGTTILGPATTNVVSPTRAQGLTSKR